MGAALESEKTTAVLDHIGEMEFNPFAILDFLSISIAKFLKLHIDFSEKLVTKPKVFNVKLFFKR